MAESKDAFNQLDQIRREVKKLNEKVDRVDEKVDRSRATQLGALATALAPNSEVSPEIVLHSAGMSNKDIAAALNKSEETVGRHIRRWKARRGKAA
jgi:DNA-binding NarL/FixJ family response regulator